MKYNQVAIVNITKHTQTIPRIRYRTVTFYDLQTGNRSETHIGPDSGLHRVG